MCIRDRSSAFSIKNSLSENIQKMCPADVQITVGKEVKNDVINNKQVKVKSILESAGCKIEDEFREYVEYDTCLLYTSDTALILYLMYIGLTGLNFIFLIIGKMPVFDAVCTAFGTAGTGGFGIKGDSMAGYSPYIQNVCTIFMLLFGVNFSCYYLVLLRRFKSIIKDSELRTYVVLILSSVALITINISGMFSSVGQALHHAAFTVSSIITTTGFATEDFNLWPNFSKTIILMLMFVGACGGSTGGGLKCGRLLIILKSVKRNIRKTLNPRKVEVIRMGGNVVKEEVVSAVNSYFVAYIVIVFLSFIFISVDGHSILTNFSSVASCFNNIGPGLDMVGPASNYSMFSDWSKLVLIGDMLAGRLEIFPILILLSKTTWSRKR